MKTIAIDGYKFEGPYRLDRDEIPTEAGVMLISTEAGEGFKIMCVEESTDMCAFIAGSDRKDIWREHAYHGEVDIYILRTDCDDSKRASIADSIASRRMATLNCQRPKVIEDDW